MLTNEKINKILKSVLSASNYGENIDKKLIRAGIKEVVEWLLNHGGLMEFIDMHYDEEWQSKLNEWGIE